MALGVAGPPDISAHCSGRNGGGPVMALGGLHNSSARFSACRRNGGGPVMALGVVAMFPSGLCLKGRNGGGPVMALGGRSP